MKKWFVLSAAVLLAACAHVNKNTVNYQTSLFDHTRYYVVAGNGPDKASAQANARANMRAARKTARRMPPNCRCWRMF